MQHWVIPVSMATAGLSLLLTLLLHVSAHVTLRRGRRKRGPTPPLSVLKPLRGIDEELEENLRSLAEQDYPEYEILFAAEDPDDPALDVARRIKRDYPSVPMRIIISDQARALNPKVRNLIAMTHVARYEHLLVSDSNVRARTDYLRAMAAETADPRVGIVSSILAGTGEETVGALLENAHLNSFILAAVCAGAGIARHPCVIGKSMLVRKTDLDAVGGWDSVRNLLAEDYVLGHRFKAAGFRVALSGHAVPTMNMRWTVRRFLSRHVRWNQMRRRIAPFAYLVEPVLYPVPWLLLLLVLAVFVHDGWLVSSQTLVIAAIAGVAVKAISDHMLSRRLRGRGFGMAALAWMPVKDLLTLLLWVIGGFRRKVSWRGHEMRICAGSRLESSNEATSWAEAAAPE